MPPASGASAAAPETAETGAPVGLDANIRRLTLFGHLVELANSTSDPAPIFAYSGKHLYITQLLVDADGRLQIQIDDIGPPNLSWPPLRTPIPTEVYAMISCNAIPAVRSDKAPLPASAVGAALVLTATLGPDGATVDGLVIPAVAKWVHQDDDRENLNFVSVRINSTTHEIRFVESPMEAYHTGGAAVIPPPGGRGIMGPWGLEGS
jgi:hypothetical protein